MINLRDDFLVLGSMFSFMVAVDVIDWHTAIRVHMWENIQTRMDANSCQLLLKKLFA